MDEAALSDGYADVGGGVRLHYVTAGEGPLVVFLHGFPDFGFTWRAILPRVARAGFRAVAVDTRGVNLSDRPAGVRAYGVDRLVADVAGLVRALGASRAHVVGHDFGAGVAWAFAMTHPETIDRLVVLNGPHPKRLIEAMKQPSQLLKSWYVFAFQVPWLPEAMLEMDRYETLIRSIRDEPRRPPSREELEHYREAYARRGALHAMINYYRAMFRPSAAPKLARIDAPVLVVWGEDDPHLERTLADPPADMVPNGRVLRVAGATHWVHWDEPERVADAIVAFLRGEDDYSARR